MDLGATIASKSDTLFRAAINNLSYNTPSQSGVQSSYKGLCMYLVSMLELILSGKGNTPRKSPTSFTVGLVTVPPYLTTPTVSAGILVCGESLPAVLGNLKLAPQFSHMTRYRCAAKRACETGDAAPKILPTRREKLTIVVCLRLSFP
jgi:hypothetical protein